LARLEIQVENDAEQSDCTHIEIVILSKTEIDNNIAWLSAEWQRASAVSHVSQSPEC
jgi:uncharacterized small protein (DUF1192 family)